MLACDLVFLAYTKLQVSKGQVHVCDDGDKKKFQIKSCQY